MKFILSRILQERDLSAWSQLKPQFFDPPYSVIFSQVSKFYEVYDKLPSFEDLTLSIRDDTTKSLVETLHDVEVPEELDTDVLLQSLVNEYAQKEVLTSVDRLVDDIVYLSAGEMVAKLSELAIELEDKTESDEQIMSMADFKTYDKDELKSFCPLGISNAFDSHSLGLAPSEFMMIGGYRGSGKSVICANIVVNQFTQGNSSLYFSIEMRGREVFQRHLSILAGVSAERLKKNSLTKEELQKVANARASMHEEGNAVYEEYLSHRDFDKFETEVLTLPLNKANQMVIIDNQSLTISSIDATIQTYKARFKDKLKVVVIDYLNVIACQDAFDWKVQIDLAKKVKGLARKHDIAIVSPFQIDEKGGVRFSKGILDAPDWAFNLQAKEHSILFENKKTRGSAPIDFESETHWDSLRILPHRNIVEEEEIENDYDEDNNSDVVPWKTGTKGDDDL